MHRFIQFPMYGDIYYRISFDIEDYKSNRMGCENSIPVAKRQKSDNLRKNRKKGEKVLGRASG